MEAVAIETQLKELMALDYQIVYLLHQTPGFAQIFPERFKQETGLVQGTQAVEHGRCHGHEPIRWASAREKHISTAESGVI
jgi:hypothetical protein